ncbi:MAG: hypothetical protein ABJB32_05720 [Verrucomicrobiota bacterium]
MMKRKLITLTAVGALALGGFAIAQTPTAQTSQTPIAQAPSRGGHAGGGRGEGGHGGDPFAKISERLNLTADQKAKAQPIFDQARPQLSAIKQETKQKTQAILEKVMSQIRPLLTKEQQQKLDDQQKHQGGKGRERGGRKGTQDTTNE